MTLQREFRSRARQRRRSRLGRLVRGRPSWCYQGPKPFGFRGMARSPSLAQTYIYVNEAHGSGGLCHQERRPRGSGIWYRSQNLGLQGYRAAILVAGLGCPPLPLRLSSTARINTGSSSIHHRQQRTLCFPSFTHSVSKKCSGSADCILKDLCLCPKLTGENPKHKSVFEP